MIEVMPYQLFLAYMLSSIGGNFLEIPLGIDISVHLRHAVGELPQALRTMSLFASVLADILPVETLVWKLKMLESASSYANSRLHAVRSQTLILSSGKDQLLPSQDEAERLCLHLSNCDSRKFNDRGHFLFLESDFELLSVIKGTSLYRCGRLRNFVSDYIPPTPSEFQSIYASYRWLENFTSPVMLSTLDDGKITRGLAGLPSLGPVLYVGYHMLLGLELVPLVSRILIERNIHVRGVAHPLMFDRKKDGFLPELSTYDSFRLMGAVPVSAKNFYRLFSSNSHVLLYPGGMREALHRKGEEYKLFWPNQSEFVRMAARFGATIVPFGTVGEDDLGEVFFDYDDIVKIPYLKAQMEQLTSEAVKLRTDAGGEVSNQEVHLPGIRPKIPGRFYYLFGKPIETKGMVNLKDREKSQELYLHVKSEVEFCLSYLKEKREMDPYRNILPRLVYQSTQGFTSEIPTFDIE
uniref:Acyltransferase n=1 Tax=Kalanchoe fedtschenkoi TaxID=63787 RepID=A0A7N0UW96_KALFE